MSARPKRKNALCRFLSGGHNVSQACLEILLLMCLVMELVVSCFSISAMTDAYFGASDNDLTTE